MAEGTSDKPKMGRPTLYSEELANIICENIATGMSLKRALEAAEAEGHPVPRMAVVFRWMKENTDFSDKYALAQEERSEAFHEELIDIADDGRNDFMEDNYQEGKTPGYALNGENIQRSKLRVETRKWVMSKMKPKKYGEKLDVTSGGDKLPSPILDLTKMTEKPEEE